MTKVAYMTYPHHDKQETAFVFVLFSVCFKQSNGGPLLLIVVNFQSCVDGSVSGGGVGAGSGSPMLLLLGQVETSSPGFPI